MHSVYAQTAKTGCPPASPELAMAGRHPEPCIMSWAGALNEPRYLETKQIGVILLTGWPTYVGKRL